MAPYLNIFSVQISTYFLLISVACTLGSVWFIERAVARKLNNVTAIDLTAMCLVGGFVGARLLHVFYEEPAFYQQDAWAILKFWQGGFVFFGGVLGAWLSALVFCVWRAEPFWFWADVAVVPVSFGYALGRLGCFFNGCCYGRRCELPWAVFMQGAHRHPTQLYAAAWETLVLVMLMRIEPRVRMSGLLFNVWLVLHALGRVGMEYFREDERGPLIQGLSLGTWISLALGMFGLLNILLGRGHRRLV